jgi:surface carbohydrate biosynthesis protein
MKKILMVVPYKARDLEGHALVGYFLERLYNHKVIYANGYNLEPKILEHAPDILLLDHLGWDFKVQQAKLAKDLGMKVVILPTEGLLQDKEGVEQIAGYMHNGTHLPDQYLAWGNWVHRVLTESGMMKGDQVSAVGCARFDFYHEDYLSLMRNRNELIGELGFADKNAPLILWATNTPYASRNPKVIQERYKKRGNLNKEYIDTFIEDNITQFKEHSALVFNLAKKRSDWNFIIKIHPAEWVNDYLEFERQASNIKIVFDKPIRDYLYTAELLLQRNCTTATEAWMFGKPVLSLDVCDYRMPVRDEFSAGNHSVSSLEETESVIEHYLNGGAIPAGQQQARQLFIEDFYLRIDGESSRRCAAKINEVLTSPDFFSENQHRKDALVAQARADYEKSEDARFTNKVKDILGVRRDKTLRFWGNLFRKESKANGGLFVAEAEITRDDVEAMYRKFDSVLKKVETKIQTDVCSVGGI